MKLSLLDMIRYFFYFSICKNILGKLSFKQCFHSVLKLRSSSGPSIYLATWVLYIMITSGTINHNNVQ